MDHNEASGSSTATQGYGTDPNLVTPDTPWPRTLSERQRKLIVALGDIILPGTDEYPAPSAVGIADFFDDWVSAPYRTQQKDATVITTGLAMVDEASHQQFGIGFAELDGSRRRMIVDQIASTTATDRSFFVRFRSLLLSGYFTTDIGFKAIGYVGNVPLVEFPGVPPEVQRIIDDELRKLGL
ncbi:gluconate 2-dehydrogenase subunit 3 family protein [Streptomyces sp. NPDC001812]|uniref:Gluconate 2-dehydrogenase subunit 3 family protein n=1 Tax=Streptomyces cathayae TaxID=3031124 RepID=A0ABY8JUE3_9ACTN|nr:gluconate 2-dehydrogenase subunit 3 family protein [Streptomyces sp. HUAS 5]WGD39069.1 gluconate 2-dehydrogenase subunit 3 family protein [Streptomyces sp. HUAS 5]